MKRGEVNWRRVDADGIKWQVCAEVQGRQWHFFHRQKRFESWELLKDPTLEDWLALYDGVLRRVQRRLMTPDQAARLKQLIRQRHPEWNQE